MAFIPLKINYKCVGKEIHALKNQSKFEWNPTEKQTTVKLKYCKSELLKLLYKKSSPIKIYNYKNTSTL